MEMVFGSRRQASENSRKKADRRVESPRSFSRGFAFAAPFALAAWALIAWLVW